MTSPYFLGNLDVKDEYGWCEDGSGGVAYVHSLRAVTHIGYPGYFGHPREFRLMGVLEGGLEGISGDLQDLVFTVPYASLVVNDDHPRLLERQLDVMAACRMLQARSLGEAGNNTATFMTGHRVNIVFPNMFYVRMEGPIVLLFGMLTKR